MNNLLDIDELQMYMNEPYVVNDYITITPPTIGDIVKWGEKRYFSMVHALSSYPADMKVQLWDMGIDYEEISEFNLFILMSRTLPKESTSILFGEIDLSKMEVCKHNDSDLCFLRNQENGAILDELAYRKIANYLRILHNISKPLRTKAANKTTKKLIIQMERDKQKQAEKEGNKSQLKYLISAMMRYPGFKYNSKQLKDCGLYEFMDTVQGAQIYISSTALIKGSYSGMIDTSKINRKEFNWMRGAEIRI